MNETTKVEATLDATVETAVEAALYLLPVHLSEVSLEQVLPARNLALVRGIKHYIVENVRSARRFLKKCDRSINIDELTFYELNRHTDPKQVAGYLAPLEQGQPMGVISEAGCPAIADPGADVVAVAQRKGLKVVPLVGPSSIVTRPVRDWAKHPVDLNKVPTIFLLYK